MTHSKGGKWGWIVETGILDLAAAVLLVRWIRHRTSGQVFDGLGPDGGAANLPPGKWRKAGVAVDLVRRIIGSQAFFFLAVTCFDRQSWINREVRGLWSAVFPRPKLPAAAAGAKVTMRDRVVGRWR